MNDNTDEITVWIKLLADEELESAEKIWAHYYSKLVQYASRKLGAVPRRDADEEDLALSAMHSFHRGVQAGRFPQLNNRDDLWKILLTITSGKVKKRIRHQMAQKRGQGVVRGESVFNHADGDGVGIDNLAGSEPTPEFAEMLSLECDELLQQLDDDVLRRIAILKLQGFSNAEIADQVGCALRSVERKLKRIRVMWSSV